MVETKTAEYTVMVPEQRTRTVNYTVAKPVTYNETQEYTVMVPYNEQRQGMRTVCPDDPGAGVRRHIV